VIYHFLNSISAYALFIFGGFGITGGAHRLWAHRCYKAKWPLRVIAAVGQTIALQVGDIALLPENYFIAQRF
jgi:stearoyl-CoA desaturase (delta-9 desaturase)